MRPAPNSGALGRSVGTSEPTDNGGKLGGALDEARANGSGGMTTTASLLVDVLREAFGITALGSTLSNG